MNIFYKIYKKLTRKSLSKYAYIQLSPITLGVLETPDNTTKERHEEVQAELKAECDAFLAWSGLEVSNKNWIMDLVYGYTTVFVLFSSYEPGANEADKGIDPANDIIREIYYAAVMGDKGTVLEDQSFEGRCRWIRKRT